jgi:hypothetical protein
VPRERPWARHEFDEEPPRSRCARAPPPPRLDGAQHRAGVSLHEVDVAGDPDGACGKALDVKDGSTADGGGVQQWAFGGRRTTTSRGASS